MGDIRCIRFVVVVMTSANARHMTRANKETEIEDQAQDQIYKLQLHVLDKKIL